MDRIPKKLLLIIAITMMPLFVAAADFSQSQSLTDTEWDTVRSRVALLDKVSYIPSLLSEKNRLKSVENIKITQAWQFLIV